MRTASDTRRRILQAAYALFYQRGFARVGVDAIADRAGLTKRTLYQYFKSKDDLLAAVISFQNDLILERIASWMRSIHANPDAMIEGLFAELGAWGTKPRFSGAGFTRIVMELADLPGHPARKLARRHKAEIEALFAAQFKSIKLPDPALRARQLMLLIEGANALLLIHGERGYCEAASAAAKTLCAGAPSRARRKSGVRAS